MAKKPEPAQAASAVATVFRPVQMYVSAYADIVKAQQRTWAALIGAVLGTGDSNRN